MGRLEEIKTRKANGEDLLHGDLTALVAAVEAVLALHQSYPAKKWNRWGDYCQECVDEWNEDLPYPCPTVAAIREHLPEAGDK